MELKKIALTLFLFAGIIGCECFNAGTEWNIADFKVSVFDKRFQAPMDGIIEGDSVMLEIFFEPEFVEVRTNPFSGLINSAYATTCESPGDDGLKDKIASFQVTSSSDFNGIKAGDSLNEIITLEGGDLINEWISGSDSWEFDYFNRITLVFTEKPAASSIHVFTLKFEMESGKIVEQSTEEIQWN